MCLYHLKASMFTLDLPQQPSACKQRQTKFPERFYRCGNFPYWKQYIHANQFAYIGSSTTHLFQSALLKCFVWFCSPKVWSNSKQIVKIFKQQLLSTWRRHPSDTAPHASRRSAWIDASPFSLASFSYRRRLFMFTLDSCWTHKLNCKQL